MTVSSSNPYSAVPTGACLICGDPISYQVRGRPRLYCDRVRCRRRGARRRALATAWEEGRVAAQADAGAEEATPTGPTYEDGVLAGQELGRSEAIHMVQVLVDTGAEFIKERNAPTFLALDLAVIRTRRWLDARREASAQDPRSSSSSADRDDRDRLGSG